jgi:hypothetical protein
MSVRRILATAICAAGLVVAPAVGASAHVHGINPLRCTPAAENAGARQTEQTPAGQGGPLTGVGIIPIAMGGNVERRDADHFGACKE